jgi:hypothetical protein
MPFHQDIVRKVFEVIFHLSVGPPPANRLQPFLGTSRNLADVTDGAKFHLDQLKGFGWAGARKSHVSIGKRGRP